MTYILWLKCVYCKIQVPSFNSWEYRTLCGRLCNMPLLFQDETIICSFFLLKFLALTQLFFLYFWRKSKTAFQVETTKLISPVISSMSMMYVIKLKKNNTYLWYLQFKLKGIPLIWIKSWNTPKKGYFLWKI